MSPPQTPKRTVLITGCSDGGLGSSLAVAFHRAGWRVFATARNTSRLASLTALTPQSDGTKIETLQLDTLDDTSIAACVAQVSALTKTKKDDDGHGSLDALINNAGAGYTMPLADASIAQGKALFDLNVWSVLAVTQAFLPLLLKSTHPTGAIIANNTSISGLTAGAFPFQGVYNASKGAAVLMTETLRLELAPLGVRVVNLVTGGVKTNFKVNEERPGIPEGSIYSAAKENIDWAMSGGDWLQGVMDREDWAEKVVRQLSARRGPPHWVWEGTFSVLGRLVALLPIGVSDFYVRRLLRLDVVGRKVREANKVGGK